MTSSASPRPDDPAGATPGEGPDPDAPEAEPLALVPAPSAPSGLRARALEARARLLPERTVIPAPRSPGGVDVPPPFGRGPGTPEPDLVAALDALIADLAAVDDAPEVPAHRALARIGDLTAAGVPDEGWSTDEGFDTEALAEAAARAASLHTAAVALLERLDTGGRPGPAAVIDSLGTSLRVVRMVAELEVFALDHG